MKKDEHPEHKWEAQIVFTRDAVNDMEGPLFLLVRCTLCPDTRVIEGKTLIMG